MNIETLFSAVSPQSTIGGEPPGRDSVLNLALACQGMPYIEWQALLWRFLRDDQARRVLDYRLALKASQSRSNAVTERAYKLAHLVTAEEHGRLDDLFASQIEHILLDCSRRQWTDTLRPEFLRLRARLDLWCRAGADRIRRRLRED